MSLDDNITRRAVLAGGGALAGAPEASSAYPQSVTLRDLARKCGLYYGVAVSGALLRDDKDFAFQVAREAGMLVAINDTKRRAIEPERGRYDFARTDAVLDFATKHGQAFRGHTLVWHKSNPPWLESALNAKPSDSLLTNYVSAVVGRYRGRVHSWDVVNEAILPADNRADGLKASPWLGAFGPDYIELAFHAARAADPAALLVYNDYGLETDHPTSEAKRKALLKFLERAKRRGAPIDAIGLQSHFRRFGYPFNPKIFASFLDELKAFDLKIVATELDVADWGPVLGQRERDNAVAGLTRDYLDVLLGSPATKAVLTWGLSDKYTWLKAESPALWPFPPRPLPLDDHFQRKPMWDALAGAFERRRKSQS